MNLRKVRLFVGLGMTTAALSIMLWGAGNSAQALTPAPCQPGHCTMPADPNQGYPAGQPAYTYATCFWGWDANSHIPSQDQLALDTGVAYYSSTWNMPPHSKIVLHGKFPR